MCQQCGQCGAVTEAPLPASLGGAPKVGPQAQAVAMALRFDAGLPVSAISRVFGELFGLPFSPGGLSQMFERNMAKFEPATVEVRNRLLDVAVMTVDETGWRQNGGRAWLFAATTPELSVFRISPHRDRETFEAMVPRVCPKFCVRAVRGRFQRSQSNPPWEEDGQLLEHPPPVLERHRPSLGRDPKREIDHLQG
jgi:hypothetical protein